MPSLKLKKCLCGYNLTVGCQVIACLGIMVYGIILMLTIAVLVSLLEKIEIDRKYSLTYTWLLLIVSSFITIIYGLIWIALLKKMPRLLLPCMVFTVLCIVHGFWCVIRGVLYLRCDGYPYAMKTVFDIYCLQVLTSQYLNMKEINRNAAAAI